MIRSCCFLSDAGQSESISEKNSSTPFIGRLKSVNKVLRLDCGHDSPPLRGARCFPLEIVESLLAPNCQIEHVNVLRPRKVVRLVQETTKWKLSSLVFGS